MNKSFFSIVLGFISFLFYILGPLNLLVSIPGLILGILALKSPNKTILLPGGFKGSYGNKKISTQSFISSKYIAYIGIAVNILSILYSLVGIITFLPLL